MTDENLPAGPADDKRGLPARAEVSIQDVVSPKGVSAWLVEDYTVPIISIRFAFKGGSPA